MNKAIYELECQWTNYKHQKSLDRRSPKKQTKILTIQAPSNAKPEIKQKMKIILTPRCKQPNHIKFAIKNNSKVDRALKESSVRIKKPLGWEKKKVDLSPKHSQNK